MDNFAELSYGELADLNGGCTGCKVGESLMVVGLVVMAPSVITVGIAVWDLIRIWG
ncbi:MAG: hypothetical protein K0R46_888 [Herbinix sp.]|jgi:hypothetical protein|nr:hypothetical protein [Herbinix sp.]